MGSTEYDYKFKLLLIGDAGVGKTSIITRFIDQNFCPAHMPTFGIGIDFRNKTVEIDGKTIKLQIWDTPGPERFRTISSSYYRATLGFLIVFDLNSKRSFDNIRSWHSECEKRRGGSSQAILVGSKSDKSGERQVSYQEGMLLAEELALNYIEVSALSGHNIGNLFGIIL